VSSSDAPHSFGLPSFALTHTSDLLLSCMSCVRACVWRRVGEWQRMQGGQAHTMITAADASTMPQHILVNPTIRSVRVSERV
jgi:hypothetical protein